MQLLKRAAVAAFCLAAGVAAAAQSKWTITDLGGDPWNVHANAVNNRGEVAGWMYAFPGGIPFHHGFLWSNGTLADLGAAGFGSSVQGMNNRGTLVGDDGVHPAIYQDGAWTALPMSGALNDVNEGNVAVGAMAFGSTVHAFLYKDGIVSDIGAPPGGSAVAWGINNAGVVAGVAYLPGSIYSWPPPTRAFVYENGAMRLLDTLGGNQGYAFDINSSGTIAGTAQDASGGFHAVVYEGGVPRSLGLPGSFSGARAINDRGQVVGTTATGSFLYDNGAVTLLESIPEVIAAGWTRLTPVAINDRGWIAGVGSRNGVGKSFVLKPS